MAKKKPLQKPKKKIVAKKKKATKKKIAPKKKKVSSKKKVTRKKANRYQRFSKLVSSWRKRKKIDFKGVNFHSVVSKMYQGIPKEEDLLPIKDIDDNYLLELFNKFSAVPKEKPLNELLPPEIDYWDLETYLAPLIDTQIYVDNSMYSGDVDDYDGGVEEFLDDGYYSDILRQLNQYIKLNFPDESERYHVYIWETDESGKIIFTLIYTGVRAEKVEGIEKPEELIKPTAPEIPKAEPTETDKQIELEKLKQSNLERELQLSKEKQKTIDKEIELEKRREKTEFVKNLPKMIKELKQAGFTKKEIDKLIKELMK